MPAFKTYAHNQQKHLAVDSQLKYDLFKLSNLTKQDSTAFHSLAEFIHSDLDNVQESITLNSYAAYNTWQFWLLIACVILAGVALVCSVSLWFRIRLLTATIVGLRALPGTNAQIPTYLSYFTTVRTTFSGLPNMASLTETPTCYCDGFSSIVSWSVALTVIVMLLIMCIVIAVSKCNSQFRCRWTFCLNIGNENENVIIPIQSFPNRPYCYAVTAETFIKSLKVEGWLKPSLQVDWPSMSVVYWPNSTAMKLKTYQLV